jgi:hypothetical protein
VISTNPGIKYKQKNTHPQEGCWYDMTFLMFWKRLCWFVGVWSFTFNRMSWCSMLEHSWSFNILLC